LSLATEEEAAEPTGRGHYSAADIPPDARVAIARIGAGLIGHGMTQANFRNLLKRQGYDVSQQSPSNWIRAEQRGRDPLSAVRVTGAPRAQTQEQVNNMNGWVHQSNLDGVPVHGRDAVAFVHRAFDLTLSVACVDKYLRESGLVVSRSGTDPKDTISTVLRRWPARWRG
jgi:transposase